MASRPACQRTCLNLNTVDGLKSSDRRFSIDSRSGLLRNRASDRSRSRSLARRINSLIDTPTLGARCNVSRTSRTMGCVVNKHVRQRRSVGRLRQVLPSCSAGSPSRNAFLALGRQRLNRRPLNVRQNRSSQATERHRWRVDECLPSQDRSNASQAMVRVNRLGIGHANARRPSSSVDGSAAIFGQVEHPLVVVA